MNDDTKVYDEELKLSREKSQAENEKAKNDLALEKQRTKTARIRGISSV